MTAIGYGTLLKRGDAGSPEVFNTVPKVKDINTHGYIN